MDTKLLTLIFSAGLVLTTLAACSTQSPVAPSSSQGAGTTAFVAASSPSSGSTFGAQTVGRTMVWVDGELFGSVVTPATFDPANGNFDELYGGCSFKDGVGLISDAKPGDQDYNGGRWHLNAIKSEGLCSKYTNAYSDADLDPADFNFTTTYFECPLTPRRGRGGR